MPPSAPRSGARPGSRPTARSIGRKPPRGPAASCLKCGKPLRGPAEALCQDCMAETEQKVRAHRERPVGGARTPFGTRIAKAIVCVECGTRDMIGFKPRAGARVLCRACAVKLLGRYEQGQSKPRATRAIVCTVCGRHDDVPAKVPDENVLCHDCARGIYSHQEDRTKSAERRSSGVILARRKKP